MFFVELGAITHGHLNYNVRSGKALKNIAVAFALKIKLLEKIYMSTYIFSRSRKKVTQQTLLHKPDSITFYTYVLSYHKYIRHKHTF